MNFFINLEIIMNELNFEEIKQVSGAGFFSRLGNAVGAVFGGGAAMQQSVNNLDDIMLGAMQYGA